MVSRFTLNWIGGVRPLLFLFIFVKLKSVYFFNCKHYVT